MNQINTAILKQTYYGLNIYGHVLRKYYPCETVLKLNGTICEPTRNPFNYGKKSLKIKIVDNVAMHSDTDNSIAAGNCFDFAKLHYGDNENALSNILNDEMNLRIPLTEILEVAPNLSPPTLKGEAMPLFSYYNAPIHNTTPKSTLNTLQVYELIKGNKYPDVTRKLRAFSLKNQASKFKSTGLDYVTFSGLFSTRSNAGLIHHSNLLTIDFDDLPNVSETRATLLGIEEFETELLFKSPSGNGLKWIIPIELTKEVTHEKYFQAVSIFLKQNFSLEADPSGKDVSRACFLCHDPEVYINPKYLNH